MADVSQPSEIQLVAVQMKLDLDAYWTREAFERKIGDLMNRVRQGIDPGLPTLVVFPEDVGLMLVLLDLKHKLGSVRHIADAIQKAIRALFAPALYHRVRHRLAWVPALFLTRHARIASVYFDVFSRAAKTYGVYLVAGSVVLPPYRLADGRANWQEGPQQARLYNTSYVFGPDGRILGRQIKVYLIDLEQEAALHLDRGSAGEIRAVETPLGRIGIAICLDSFQDEVTEALKEDGTDILVQPSANPGPWSPEQQLDWLNSSYKRTVVEKSFAYAVNPMMTGAIWDVEFYGQSSIIARDMGKDEGSVGRGPGVSSSGPDASSDVSAGSSGGTLGYRDLGPMKGFLAVAGDDAGEEILVARVPHPRTLDRPDQSAISSTRPS